VRRTRALHVSLTSIGASKRHRAPARPGLIVRLQTLPFLGAIVSRSSRSTTLGNSSPIYSSHYSKPRIAVNSEVYDSLAQGSSGTAITTAEASGAAVTMRQGAALWWATTGPADRVDAGPRETQLSVLGHRQSRTWCGRQAREYLVSRRLCGGSPAALQRTLPSTSSSILAASNVETAVGQVTTDLTIN
jgi:hypothetical protein